MGFLGAVSRRPAEPRGPMGRRHRPLRRGPRPRRETEVRLTKDFAADVEAQISWLSSHRETSWVVRLELELEEARELLGRFPRAGTPDSAGKAQFRRLV